MIRRALSACLLALLASVPLAVSQEPGLARRVSQLAWAKDVAAAQALIERNRPQVKQLTPEWLLAVSWLARGAQFAERWDVAEKAAGETLQGSMALLKSRPLDAEPQLPTALGAAIEVLGHTYAARGDRARALEFLGEQVAAYRGSSIEMRIQKNILLLSLEGKPMPALDVQSELSATRFDRARLGGKVVVFYFWAHWCGDCKRQKPILAELHKKYAGQGLEIVGPTQLYGFVSRGRDATPAEELTYLRGEYHQAHPIPGWMPAPLVSQRNFSAFGVSTTPTLVIVDRTGAVLLYHPGLMTLDQLEAAIRPLLSASAR